MGAAEQLENDPIPELQDAPASGAMRRMPVTGELHETGEAKTTELQPGDVVADRYIIERVIGCGGHGSILRAMHRELELPVAIKVLHVAATDRMSAELAVRFVRESRIAARIRHRHVLSVHDAGRLPDGSPYLVMELIEGEDLERRIARGPLSIASVVELGRQLFSGLTAISEAGVLHRDVKPANIMLHRETDGQVLIKLVDFGIARTRGELERLTVTGAIVGTPHYMSPEQLRGEEIDARADLYAACAVLYEATTGRPPYDGAATALVIGQILAGTLAPVRELRPDCPQALAQLIERGLSRKRADRPGHPMEVVALLDAIVRAEHLPAGALAWAGDVAMSLTLPIDLTRRRIETPKPRPSDPDAPFTPPAIEEQEPMREPQPPDGIEDPNPAIPPRRARGMLAMFAASALGFAFATALSFAGRQPLAEATPVPPLAASVPNNMQGADVDALLDQGFEALARGEIDAALMHYRAAAAADPSRPEAQRGRGLAATRAGLDDEAIAAFEHYLAIAPDASDAERVRDRLTAVRERRSQRVAGSSAPSTAPVPRSAHR